MTLYLLRVAPSIVFRFAGAVCCSVFVVNLLLGSGRRVGLFHPVSTDCRNDLSNGPGVQTSKFRVVIWFCAHEMSPLCPVLRVCSVPANSPARGTGGGGEGWYWSSECPNPQTYGPCDNCTSVCDRKGLTCNGLITASNITSARDFER